MTYFAKYFKYDGNTLKSQSCYSFIELNSLFYFLIVLFFFLIFPHLCEAKLENYTKIPVGNTPSGIVYDSDNNNIYVANLNSNSISVIDGSTDKVKSIILVDEKPNSMIYNKNNRLLYVININTHNMFAIDTLTNNIINNTYLKKDENDTKIYYPYAMVLRDPHTIYIANLIDNSTSVINASSKKLDIIRGIGKHPIALTYDLLNEGIYVANSLSNSVSVINPFTKKVIANISVGKFPIALTYDYRNNFIYVICRDSHDVYVINGNNNTVISKKALPDGSKPLSIEVNPYTRSIVITNNITNTVLEIDSNTNSLIKNTSIDQDKNYNIIKTYHPPERIAINFKNNKMYITSPETNEVFVIEAKKNTYIPEDVKLHVASIIISFIALPILIVILWYIIAKRKKYQKKIK